MSIEPIRPRTCPICNYKTDLHYRPFCSKRCADVDLGRWLSGVYAIPVLDNDEDGVNATPANSGAESEGR